MNSPLPQSAPPSDDVIILGAGAAGLMAAIEAGKRGRRVRVVDHTSHPGEKIRISGGGRCNFTNINTKPAQYLSQNPHFCTSALKRYTPQHFIQLVQHYGIAYHEKALGQLFCDGSAKQIVDLLLKECADANVIIDAGATITDVRAAEGGGFTVTNTRASRQCQSLIVATGGLSIPKIGASPFGYELAKQFEHPLIAPRPALVPLTFQGTLLTELADLAGLSVDPIEVSASCGQRFREALLFTHRGLSGPAILQVSSYWREGQDITLNLLPDLDLLTHLQNMRRTAAKQQVQTVLGDLLPRRLADFLTIRAGIEGRMADLSDEKLKKLTAQVCAWTVKPNGSEGYRTAEVTLGGVDTHALSSKTMESRTVPGLYFIGEVVDVTGHLGGYNFQWAWSSGWCAGQYA